MLVRTTQVQGVKPALDRRTSGARSVLGDRRVARTTTGSSLIRSFDTRVEIRHWQDRLDRPPNPQRLGTQFPLAYLRADAQVQLGNQHWPAQLIFA